MGQTTAARHAERGARFGERDGRERLLDFGSFEEEYAALDGGCALFDLSEHGLFAVTGEDRTRFLNGLLTNDVAALAPGSGCRACQLTRQSKVLSDLRICAGRDRFLIETEAGAEEEALSHLRRYKIADRVSFEPLSDTMPRLSLQGPRTSDVIASLLGREAVEELLGMAPYDHRAVRPEEPVLMVRVPRTGRSGVDLLAPASQRDALWGALIDAGAHPAGWLALEAGRIEAGLPRFGSDFGPENLFMEVGLPDAVSFTKGCYVGQEIVARVRSRGHVNRTIARLRVEGAASVGDPIRTGEGLIGRVTSATLSPKFGATLALGILRAEVARAPGTQCQVGEVEPFTPATVLEPPAQGARQP